VQQRAAANQTVGVDVSLVHGSSITGPCKFELRGEDAAEFFRELAETLAETGLSIDVCLRYLAGEKIDRFVAAIRQIVEEHEKVEEEWASARAFPRFPPVV
jgi:coenzyme F420-reducing hydrogenase delta subunit